MARLLISLFAAAAAVLAQSDLENGLGGAGIFAVFSDDPGYSEASAAFNLRYDFKPAAVAFPSTTEQVSAAVALGASDNYQVVARSGGHSYIANGLGGKSGVLVIDLSNMTSITYDSATELATLQTGLRLGDVALALNDNGRALPHGSCPYVGIGGHAAGGGFGFTSRMWGLTLDTIQELEVVLANGTVATASNDVNADLFWAMRGAAPSFGITTKMIMKTSPVPDYAIIFQYSWSLNATAAGAAFVSFENFLFTDIPPEIGMELVLYRGSESGLVGISLSGGYYGESEATLDATLAPLLAQLPPYDSRTLSGDGTYIGTVSVLGDGTISTHNAKDVNDTFYAKSLMTPESEIITLEAATAFMTYLANEGYESGTSTTNWFIQPEVYGGSNSKINAVDDDATSFGSRNSLLTIQFYASSFDYAPPFPDAGFDFLDGMVASITDNMRDGWDYGAYYNYPDDRLDNWQSLYYRGHYSRLESLKTTYDPNGVFKFPLTVE
ncbi:glucooligosaccharide oxidase [Hymenopellis radicata]|nr:glucooligosaccharide oxidase [Hymenopellis radicata]